MNSKSNSSEKVHEYLQKKNIPDLFEALMAGLMFKQPDDPVSYIEECLSGMKSRSGNHAKWNQFIETEKVCKTEELNAIFVLGGPGSGKGTQCARLVKDFGVHHVSVGDLLRDEVNNKTETGLQIENIMKEGKMVPLDIVLTALRTRLASLKDKKSSSVLIDGFPREMQQALEFEQKVGTARGILYFECSEETMTNRLMKRGETSGRTDDNEETIKKRLMTFKEQSVPVIEYFQKSGRLFQVSSDNRSSEDVYADVKSIFTQYILNSQ